MLRAGALYRRNPGLSRRIGIIKCGEELGEPAIMNKNK